MFLVILKYLFGVVFVLLALFLLLKSFFGLIRSIKDLKNNKKEDAQVDRSSDNNSDN